MKHILSHFTNRTIKVMQIQWLAPKSINMLKNQDSNKSSLASITFLVTPNYSIPLMMVELIAIKVIDSVEYRNGAASEIAYSSCLLHGSSFTSKVNWPPGGGSRIAVFPSCPGPFSPPCMPCLVLQEELTLHSISEFKQCFYLHYSF